MADPKTTELLTRLRECVVGHPALMDAAADEIERLRALIRQVIAAKRMPHEWVERAEERSGAG